ncbi:MAG: hypothetical protein ABSF38_07425 [Verrucomicrobiota bacterium]|jgi:hypothetical protein
MTQNLKAVTVAALTSVLALAAQAQTNLVQTIGVTLTANYQGTNTTNGTTVKQVIKSESIKTAEIIGLIGAVEGTNLPTTTQLLKVTPIINGSNGPYTNIVRWITYTNATNATTHKVTKVYTTNNLDVTRFFTVGSLGSLSTSTSNNGVLGAKGGLSIRTLAFSDTNNPALKTTLSLQALVDETYQKVTKDGVVVWAPNDTWTVNGTGSNAVEGSLIIGASPSTITISSPVLEFGPGY